MSMQIQGLKIAKLHGFNNYNISIHGNRIIMVGVNGLGKTTVVNLLHLILSRQWDRISEYEFTSIDITIDEREYKLSQEKRDDVDKEVAKRLRTLLRRHSMSYSSEDRPLSYYEELASIARRQGRDALAHELDRRSPIPTITCRRIAMEVPLNPNSIDKDQIAALDGVLASATRPYQVLYLPTYRRVEKELAHIFPDMEESVRRYQGRRGVLQRETGKEHIELVEFGMEDVAATFARSRLELVEASKLELTNLTAEYLRDVIRGEGDQYDARTFRDLNKSIIHRILNRAEEQTLSENDKLRLKDVIDRIKSSDESVEPDGFTTADRYIAHFFSKLLEVDSALAEKERQIHKFAEVCNRYLVGKHVIYDDKTSRLGVFLTRNEQPLTLRSLSSGEKQIVSLFSHLYLRSTKNMFVLIDEPELSLSVSWQSKLLPDIWDTGKCDFLAAVTHSPFVFANTMDPYAIDLRKCITESAQ